MHMTQPVVGATGTASCGRKPWADNGLERSSPRETRIAIVVNQGSEMCTSNINKTERDVDLKEVSARKSWYFITANISWWSEQNYVSTYGSGLYSLKPPQVRVPRILIIIIIDVTFFS